MQIQLTKCPELNILYRSWFNRCATVDEVWDHRQACPVCRENARLLTSQAETMEYPEDEKVTA